MLEPCFISLSVFGSCRARYYTKSQFITNGVIDMKILYFNKELWCPAGTALVSISKGNDNFIGPGTASVRISMIHILG